MKFSLTFLLTILLTAAVFAQKQAEVIVTSTYLRAAPNISSEKLRKLEKGTKTTLEKSGANKGWYFVSIEQGSVKGWIRADTVSKPETIAKPIAAQISVSEKKPPVSAPQPTKTPAAAPQKTVAQAAVTPAAVTAPTAAESPAVIEDTEVLRIDTDEVSLNVRVVNAANRPVGNLARDQFKVYEDDVLQPITSLTTTEVPIINALLIDNSRSLRSQLAKVIEAGKIIVGTNRPKDESAIIRFVSSDKIEVVQDFTFSQTALAAALDNLYVEGGQTAVIDAIYRTAEKLEKYSTSDKKEDTKIRALIVVSDGDDRSSQYDENQLFQLLRNSSVQIYTIGFVNNLNRTSDADAADRLTKAKSFLTRLAEETGGKAFFPASNDELPKIAADISSELRTQYTVSYAPTNETRDGTFRRIKVEITDGTDREKRIAVTRAGRNAQPK